MKKIVIFAPLKEKKEKRKKRKKAFIQLQCGSRWYYMDKYNPKHTELKFKI